MQRCRRQISFVMFDDEYDAKRGWEAVSDDSSDGENVWRVKRRVSGEVDVLRARHLLSDA